MTDVELEWRLVYAIVVAGKSARFTNRVVALLRDLVLDRAPIRTLVARPEYLRIARSGRYGLMNRALSVLDERRPDLRTCSSTDLEVVPGIGPKTARFFVAWTRPDARVAVLDRHVLRWMRELGYDAPVATPAGRKYLELEAFFIAEADLRGKTPRELDLEIWGATATAPNLTGGEP
jgi:thermostable 8-oxoguanine DNA glycosylase